MKSEYVTNPVELLCDGHWKTPSTGERNI